MIKCDKGEVKLSGVPAVIKSDITSILKAYRDMMEEKGEPGNKINEDISLMVKYSAMGNAELKKEIINLLTSDLLKRFLKDE